MHRLLFACIYFSIMCNERLWYRVIEKNFSIMLIVVYTLTCILNTIFKETVKRIFPREMSRQKREVIAQTYVGREAQLKISGDNIKNTMIVLNSGRQDLGDLDFGSQGSVLPKEILEPDYDDHASIESQGGVAPEVITVYRKNVYEHHYIDNQEVPKKEEFSFDDYRDFLSCAKAYYHDFSNKTVDCSSEPRKLLLNMEAGYDNILSPSYEQSNLERKEIELGQFHEALDGKHIRSVLLLGEPSAGKSILKDKYAYEVVMGKLKFLQDIELVINVEAKSLQDSNMSTAFDLFFTQQVSQTKLNRRLRSAGQDWMEKNSNKVMIIIDGVDQSPFQFGGRQCPKFNGLMKVHPYEIIGSLLRGEIWHHALILMTSRIEILSHLLPAEKPDRLILLRGFDERRTELAAVQMSPQRGKEMLSYFKAKAPQAFTLCKNPLLLSYAVELFLSCSNGKQYTISGFLSEVFLRYLYSEHARDPDIKQATKLAYYGIMDDRFTFTVKYLENIGIKQNDLKGFLACTFSPPGQEIKKRFYFPHQYQQELCAALYICAMKLDEVEVAIEKLKESRFEFLKILLYGIILGDKIPVVAADYLEDQECPVQKFQEILIGQLQSKIKNGLIQDFEIFCLLSECGDGFIQNLKPDIQHIEIRDGTNLLKYHHIDLASIIKKLSPIRKVFVKELTLGYGLLKNILNCYKEIELFEIHTLLICDDDFTPTDDLITELFRFLHDVVSRIEIQGWILKDNQNEVLMDVCEAPTTKVAALKLPGMQSWINNSSILQSTNT